MFLDNDLTEAEYVVGERIPRLGMISYLHGWPLTQAFTLPRMRIRTGMMDPT